MENSLFKGLASFSLLELTIALVISSVVISGVFVIIGFANKFLSDYRRNYEAVNEVVVFSRLMNQDCFYARGIQVDSESVIEIVKDEESVLFYFLNNRIVREAAMGSDTFDIKVLDEEVVIGSGQDYLSLQVEFKRDTIPLFFKVLKYNRARVKHGF